MALTKPLPPELRAELARDPFYKRCCLTGWVNTKIEWHHNFIFAGKRVNEKWCILPVSADLHKQVKGDKETKRKLDWVMLNRADDETLKRYSKSEDLTAKRDRLNAEYGKPKWV